MNIHETGWMAMLYKDTSVIFYTIRYNFKQQFPAALISSKLLHTKNEPPNLLIWITSGAPFWEGGNYDSFYDIAIYSVIRKTSTISYSCIIHDAKTKKEEHKKLRCQENSLSFMVIFFFNPEFIGFGEYW